MGRRGAVRGVVLAVVVLGSLLAWPQPGRAASFSVRNQATLLPGVEVQGLRDANGPLSIDVGRVSKGAAVRVEAIASGAVAGGVETTSGVCRRVGGILCVNADFSACQTCTTTFGGIIREGVVQRSPVSDHSQLWLGAAGPGAGKLSVSASLEATVTYLTPPAGGLGPPTQRVERPRLDLDAINRTRGANQVVLYTPAWSGNTRTRGGDEALLGGVARIGTSPVTTRSWLGNGGSSAIPGDGLVLSADGAGRAPMGAFFGKANDPNAIRRSVVLRLTANHPVDDSVGGHPVIMTNGQTVIGGSTDPFATNRHPRTLVGWNAAGDLILATVDGRQSSSAGVSLVQAAGVLRQLGATNGFNLDGGGSSTFVSLAPGGSRTPQVLNRPSDGNERRITTVLAVVPVNPASVRVRGAGPAPPQPPAAPPGPPPADEASASGLAAAATRTRPPGTTTTTAPPEPSAPVVTDPLPPESLPDPSALADVELSAPPPMPVAPIHPGHQSTGLPATVAALALLAAAAATFRTSRQSKRLKAASGSTHPGAGRI